MNVNCFLSGIVFLIFSCQSGPGKYEIKPLSEESHNYWYNGDAEITSYELTQARYGELRNGKAVMIFVTEPFSPASFTKADKHYRNNVPVLKLNFTKNFETGIYPYSMMTSTFYPVDGSSASLKISSSSQEWCGQTYVEMHNNGRLKFDVRSYFEGENMKTKLKNSFLEDDIWSMIKLHPSSLPVGNITMIPSMFYLRLMHKIIKTYKCDASLTTTEKITEYRIYYPELQRDVIIKFENDFPYKIKEWSESYPDGFGDQAAILTTTGKILKTLKTVYWQQNSNEFIMFRDSLMLK